MDSESEERRREKIHRQQRAELEQQKLARGPNTFLIRIEGNKVYRNIYAMRAELEGEPGGGPDSETS